MAILFDGSTQSFLRRPIHPRLAPGGAYAYPFYVGCWIKPTILAASRSVWAISNIGSDTEYISLLSTSGGNYTLSRRDTTLGAINANLGGGIAAVDKWSFVLIMAISTTNLKIAGVDFNGLVTQSSSAGLCNPVSPTHITLGARSQLTGDVSGNTNNHIAEFFYGLGTPIGSASGYGGTNNNSAVFRRLAQYGPWAIPGMINSILEHRSFYTGHRSFDVDRDFQSGPSTPWTSGTTAIPLTAGPQLSALYRRPGKNKRVMVY